MSYLAKLVRQCHNFKLTKKHAHVVQIWHDGWITTVRTYPLYEHEPRTLVGSINERDTRGITPNLPADNMPQQSQSEDKPSKGYAFVRHPEALCLREAMVQAVKDGGDLTEQNYSVFRDRLNDIPR